MYFYDVYVLLDNMYQNLNPLAEKTFYSISESSKIVDAEGKLCSI